MDVTKPHNILGFGAMDVTKPYEFIWFFFGGGLLFTQGELHSQLTHTQSTEAGLLMHSLDEPGLRPGSVNASNCSKNEGTFGADVEHVRGTCTTLSEHPTKTIHLNIT